jgi:hypothetical protein
MQGPSLSCPSCFVWYPQHPMKVFVSAVTGQPVQVCCMLVLACTGKWIFTLSCRLSVKNHDDQRFINLLRQSHVMPFTSLPNTGDPTADGAMFAVLQPVDAIAVSSLQCLASAHERRASWRASWPASQNANDVPTPSMHAESNRLLPQDPRKWARPGAPATAEVRKDALLPQSPNSIARPVFSAFFIVLAMLLGHLP